MTHSRPMRVAVDMRAFRTAPVAIASLLLLALRERPIMPVLLVVHLAIVLALFITFPYGKFVHGIYRGAALLKFRREEQ